MADEDESLLGTIQKFLTAKFALNELTPQQAPAATPAGDPNAASTVSEQNLDPSTFGATPPPAATPTAAPSSPPTVASMQDSGQPSSLVDQITKFMSHPLVGAALGGLGGALAVPRHATPGQRIGGGVLTGLGGMETAQRMGLLQQQQESVNKLREAETAAYGERQKQEKQKQDVFNRLPQDQKPLALFPGLSRMIPRQPSLTEVAKQTTEARTREAEAVLSAGAQDLLTSGQATTLPEAMIRYVSAHPQLRNDLTPETRKLIYRGEPTDKPKAPSEGDKERDILARGMGAKDFADLQQRDPRKASEIEMQRKTPALTVQNQGLGGGQGGLTVPLGGSGEEVLRGVDPGTAAIVKSLVEYRMPLPSGFTLRSPQWSRIVALANLYDPSFDVKQYPLRLATEKDFRVGNAAKNIRSLNTAVQHLDELSKASDGLANSSIQLWNTIANRGLTAVDDPRVTKFNNAATAVSNELATVFKNTTGTDQEIKQWRENISSSQGPNQLEANIGEVIKLMGGRFDALQSQYKNAMGKQIDFQMLSPRARQILTKLGANPDVFDPAGSGSQGPVIRDYTGGAGK